VEEWMNISAKLELVEIEKAWKALQKRTSLTPIKNKSEYETMVSLLNNLIDIVGSNERHPLADLMEIVGDLIARYEGVAFPIKDAKPNQVLAYLMQEHSLKQKDLNDIVSQGVLSEILAGKRDISKSVAKALAAYFGVSPAVFI
jgi:HTH-type transcriptional regulator/antitoxin HigA